MDQEVQRQMEILGFEFEKDQLVDTPEGRRKFMALVGLMAEFVKWESMGGELSIECSGLEEAAEEWLVG